MPKLKKQNYTQTVARRRRAIARVRLLKGKGESLVNSQPVDVYFSGSVFKDVWKRPLELTGVEDKYFITAKIEGGGKKGQLDAFILGIAKALVKENAEKFKKPIKTAGFLTRDARIRQRRMVGMGGKSRRKKQSPKR